MLSLSFCLSPPLSRSRVYLVAQERQDGVSNWLCVQVMLPPTPSTAASSGQSGKKKTWGHHHKKRRKRENRKKKCQSSQKSNNCCTIIQTSYNSATWFGLFVFTWGTLTRLLPLSLPLFSPPFFQFFLSWPLTLLCVCLVVFFLFVFFDLQVYSCQWLLFPLSVFQKLLAVGRGGAIGKRTCKSCLYLYNSCVWKKKRERENDWTFRSFPPKKFSLKGLFLKKRENYGIFKEGI